MCQWESFNKAPRDSLNFEIAGWQKECVQINKHNVKPVKLEEMVVLKEMKKLRVGTDLKLTQLL